MTMSEVLVEGITKRFGEAIAVDRVDLTLKAGTLSTLLGPSGCGKTTTLRMIAGLEHPDEGRIAIDDQVVFEQRKVVAPEDRQIGMVFQSYAVWPHLTVFENVAYPLRVRRASRQEIERQVTSALRTVQMEHLAARFPAQLSGGQQQRVALARAIVYAPRLLLLDEPLSNLDAQLRDEMRNEIRQMQSRLGLTALYVTHDQSEALAISDFVAVMNKGRVVQRGTPRDIYQRPASRFVAQFLGWTNFLPAERQGPNSARVLDWTVPRQAGNESARLCASIRPDCLSLDSPDRPGRLGLLAHVTNVTFLGHQCACDLAVAGQVLQARVSAELAPSVGEEVRVSFDADHLLVMPDDVDVQR
jgi:ABC-type Fe3+/spermidine/putrescine transport system ATPase subunit